MSYILYIKYVIVKKSVYYWILQSILYIGWKRCSKQCQQVIHINNFSANLKFPLKHCNTYDLLKVRHIKIFKTMAMVIGGSHCEEQYGKVVYATVTNT